MHTTYLNPPLLSIQREWYMWREQHEIKHLTQSVGTIYCYELNDAKCVYGYVVNKQLGVALTGGRVST